jgi:polyphosphate kinase 2 (PPK2 family)
MDENVPVKLALATLQIPTQNERNSEVVWKIRMSVPARGIVESRHTCTPS